MPLYEQAGAIGGIAGASAGPLRRVSFGRGYARHSLLAVFQENLEHFPVLLPVDLESGPEQFSHLRLHNGTIWYIHSRYKTGGSFGQQCHSTGMHLSNMVLHGFMIGKTDHHLRWGYFLIANFRSAHHRHDTTKGLTQKAALNAFRQF